MSIPDTTAGFKYSFDFNNDGDFVDAGEISDSTTFSANVPATLLAAAGARTIRARIKDKDGGFTDLLTSLNVVRRDSTSTLLLLNNVNVPPKIERDSLTPEILPGGTAILAGQLTDLNPGDVLSIQVNWGDGSPVETFRPSAETFAFTHAFNKPGAFDVGITYLDDKGGHITKTRALVVSNTNFGRFALAGQGTVQVFDARTRQHVRDVVPFAGYVGSVSVAVGDVNADGVQDLIAGTMIGSSHVKVFDGATGKQLLSFLAFDNFAGGVNVGSWDVTGDGKADIIVGTATASSHVKVFSGSDGSLFRSFLAFAGYMGGVSVAGGDVDNDGMDDIIVGTARAASHVKAFRGSDLVEVRSFLAVAGFNGGVTVASGDVNNDGTSDIVVGTATVNAHVKAFAGHDLRELASFAIAVAGR